MTQDWFVDVNNGYPNDVIEKSIRQKLCRSNEELIGPKKNIVYLKLPYKGNSCEKIAKKIENAVCSTYNAVKTRIILTTQSMMPNSQKDTLKQINKSEVVYKFTCNRCESEYIGKSSRRFCDRISEHVPS